MIHLEDSRIIGLKYAWYEAALKEKEDKHQELHRYLHELENAICEAGGKVHLDYDAPADQYTCRVELPTTPSPDPVADIDAAAIRYADDVIHRDEFHENKDAVTFNIENGAMLWLVAPCVNGDLAELVLRQMLAHCLSDFYRQQTEGK